MNHVLQSGIKKSFKVSIITVTLNCRDDIEETIKSVISQNYDFKEFIIIDGHSKDGTLEMIDKYKDFIDFIIVERDNGIYDAMNKGVQKSSGDFIHFLNAGDKYCNENSLNSISKHLNIHLNLIKFSVIVEQGLIRRERASFFYLGRRMLNHQGIFYNRLVFDQNLFDPNLKISGDFKHLVEFDLWKKVTYVDETIVIFKGQGIASRNPSILLNYKERLGVLKWKGCSSFLKMYIFSFALLGFIYKSLSK